MCRVLQVSRSGYSIYAARPRSRRAIDDALPSQRVATIFDSSDGTYGASRVKKQLHTEGRLVSRYRVARLMREMRLSASPRKKFVVTTGSKHHHPVAPNVLNREFTAKAPNQKWAGDITYIPTSDGWLFLAVFLDLFSRRVIGRAMGPTIDGSLTRRALAMALRNRQPSGSLIVHSDRGVQYAAHEFQRMLRDWSITPSMSRRGNCYDNAVVEIFFATLKKERVHREKYAKREDAESRIFQYIEGFYNPRRMHSTLDYMSPNAYERAWGRAHSVSPTEETPTVVHPSEGKGFSMVGGVPTGPKSCRSHHSLVSTISGQFRTLVQLIQQPYCHRSQSNSSFFILREVHFFRQFPPLHSHRSGGQFKIQHHSFVFVFEIMAMEDIDALFGAETNDGANCLGCTNKDRVFPPEVDGRGRGRSVAGEDLKEGVVNVHRMGDGREVGELPDFHGAGIGRHIDTIHVERRLADHMPGHIAGHLHPQLKRPRQRSRIRIESFIRNEG